MSDDKHGPQPSLRPTAPSTVAVSALAGGALTLLLVARYYQYAPALAWYNSTTIFALAVVLAWLGWHTRREIRPPRRGGTDADSRPPRDDARTLSLHPLQIARLAVLAKAAAIGGALFFGAYFGVAVWLTAQRDRLTAAAEDLPGALLGTAACAMLVAGALWLEHSCRIPPKEEDDDEA